MLVSVHRRRAGLPRRLDVVLYAVALAQDPASRARGRPKIPTSRRSCFGSGRERPQGRRRGRRVGRGRAQRGRRACRERSGRSVVPHPLVAAKSGTGSGGRRGRTPQSLGAVGTLASADRSRGGRVGDRRHKNRLMLIATSTSSSVIVLVGAVFLACAVEMVEALTIVFAVGPHARLAPRVRRDGGGARGARRARRGVRTGSRARAARRAAPRGRRRALDLRDAVAAQGDSSRHAAFVGEARRGRDLSKNGRRA